MNQNRAASLGYRFGMLSRLNTFFLNNQLKPLGLSAGQVSCLAEILHRDIPVTQDEISAAMAIDPAATARTVELLVKKGLAARVVNPENRRQNLVSATPAAKKIAGAFFDALKNAENNFDVDMTVEERRVLIELMDRMIASAKRRKHEQRK
ncbi:MarR family transcriptional regulator [uncultured Desulfosarcina sp.]|uniref:MarR family winged helix-turn-helix transcriptional regulator n=1 Tax=uncultured Desulfosarcina sp. TaxID=218289 RepID=UPI0029C95CAA|nr:MarR family transcriptional regulator [uncultured Desulfosarcina sp.]